MRRVASLLVLSALALALSPRTATAQSPDACIKYWAEARYGALAYNHLVHIANSCDLDADCTVSTNVAPEPLEVEVEAKSEVTVTTFMGSPARTFTPHVKCTMRR